MQHLRSNGLARGIARLFACTLAGISMMPVLASHAGECPFHCKKPPVAENCAEVFALSKLPLPPGPSRFEGLKAVVTQSLNSDALVERYGGILYMPLAPRWSNQVFKGLSTLPEWAGGPFFSSLSQLPASVAMISDPAAAYQVMTHSDEFDRPYKAVKLVGENSIFTKQSYGEDYEQWKVMHNAMAKYFTPGFISEAYSSTIDRFVAEQISRWLEAAPALGGLVFDIQPGNRMLSIKIALRTLLGVELPENEILKIQPVLDQVLTSDAPELRTQLLGWAKHLLEIRVSGQGELIEGLLATAQEAKLPEEWVLDQIITLIFASQETTRSLMDWSMVELARHPEMSDRIENERGFLDRFVNEVLRLHSIVPTIPRITREDLEVGGFKLPKGTLVQINSGRLSLSKKLWGETAAQFDPERFAGGMPAKGAFIPFGAGQRICPGLFVAKAEVKALVLGLIKARVRLGLIPGFDPKLHNVTGSISIRGPLPVFFGGGE